MRHPKIFVMAFLILLAPLACKTGLPFDHQTSAPTPPPNPIAATITITSFDFDNGGPIASAYTAGVTIRPGGTVTWVNNSGFYHWIEMGDGAGNCAAPVNALPDGTSLTLSFPASGTYYYHNPYAGTCSSGNCDSTCNNGMVGVVHVQ